MSKNSKILYILLISLLFIFIGFYLSIKITHNKINYIPRRDKMILQISPFPTSSGRLNAKVKKVIDGDTILLSDNRKVRYIGVNTPELANGKTSEQCFATEAANFNKQLVENQNIELEKDISETDKYGRLLRFIYSDGVLINELLLTQGYAKLEEIPPDTKYYKQFKMAENEAREAKRGLWGKCVQ